MLLAHPLSLGPTWLALANGREQVQHKQVWSDFLYCTSPFTVENTFWLHHWSKEGEETSWPGPGSMGLCSKLQVGYAALIQMTSDDSRWCAKDRGCLHSFDKYSRMVEGTALNALSATYREREGSPITWCKEGGERTKHVGLDLDSVLTVQETLGNYAMCLSFPIWNTKKITGPT